MKTCTNCGGSGPFGRNKSVKSGLKSHCKKCCADKQAAYRVKRPVVWANWAAANVGYLEAKDAARYAEDPERGKARVREWQERNPERVKAIALRANLRKYNLTPEDKQALFEKQQGKCGICSGELKPGRTGMQIDHDHSTEKVRGLLCHLCNMMLGDFQEDPLRFEAAVRYLGRPLVPRGPKRRRTGLKPGTRAANLWYGYGLTLEDFQALFELQSGVCGICPDLLKPGNGTHIDHDHKGRSVRGLLCRPCNLGLGHARENTTILQRAVAYVRTHFSVL